MALMRASKSAEDVVSECGYGASHINKANWKSSRSCELKLVE